jgi:DNA-binding CsgD family transcriptional regulator
MLPTEHRSPSPDVLIGRERECDQLLRLLDGARSGQSGVLLISGEPGIGKTSLLRHAAEQFEPGLVLQAPAVQAEAEIGYAGLLSLLHDHLVGLAALAAPQRRALASALGVGTPLAADRFLIGAALLNLLADLADKSPVLVLVDDSHWLDASSTEALLFAARRLHAERVAVIFSTLTTELATLEGHGLPTMCLDGLASDAARTLLERRSGEMVAAGVAERLTRATGGNPLALAELAALLSRDQLSGRDPVEDPLAPGPAIEAAFRRRINELPPATRIALAVAALAQPDEAGIVLGVMAKLDLPPEALHDAEALGLVTLRAGVLEFRHPLVRSVAFHAVSAQDRRRMHALFADVLGSTRAVERSWHRAAGTIGRDESVARDLESAAASCRARSSPSSAGRAMEVAARLSPDGENAIRRSLQAAQDFALAGRPEPAVRALDDVLRQSDSGLVRAQAHLLRGQVEMLRGPPGETRDRLLAEARHIESTDAALAALMLLGASIGSTMAGEPRVGLELAQRVARLVEQEALPLSPAPELQLAVTLILRGEARRTREIFARLVPPVDPMDAWMSAAFTVVCLWLGEPARGREHAQACVSAARRAGAIAPLPFLLASLASVDWRTGCWDAAYAGAAESVTLAEDTGQLNEASNSLAVLAQIEAGQGREGACREHADRALQIAQRLGTRSTRTLATAALALLHSGFGRPAKALECCQNVERWSDEQGLEEPETARTAPDHIEASFRLKRIREARRALDRLESAAEQTGGNWALATSARCRGLLASQRDFERDFHTALELHAAVDDPFESARTELCFGERLRRARRPREARHCLHRALVVFDHLGASPWGDRTRAELRATGERLLPQTGRQLQELTAQELQVTLAVARGATNKEVATALFLSAKTVEFHLGNVYRKLGLRSRTELAVRLGDRAGADALAIRH